MSSSQKILIQNQKKIASNRQHKHLSFVGKNKRISIVKNKIRAKNRP